MTSNKLIGKRLLALLIDLIVLGQIISLTDNFIQLNYEIGKQNMFGLNASYGYSLAFILYMFYFFAFDFFNKGVTVGKKTIGIYLVKHNGIISRKDFFKRTSIKLLGIFLFPISILWYILFNIIFQDYFMPELYTTSTNKETSLP